MERFHKTTNNKVPRGLRNNNPGNLRSNPYNEHFWKKQIGSDGQFCKFESMYFGIRALCRLLLTYYKRGWLKNAVIFVEHYAPASDHNNVLAYAAYVSSAWLYGEFSPHQLAVLIMQMENGESFIDDEMIKFARYWSYYFFSAYFGVTPTNADMPICTKESAF